MHLEEGAMAFVVMTILRFSTKIFLEGQIHFSYSGNVPDRNILYTTRQDRQYFHSTHHA
jgi:hypothetical protein